MIAATREEIPIADDAVKEHSHSPQSAMLAEHNNTELNQWKKTKKPRLTTEAFYYLNISEVF
ncbi:MAG: hypothetical protein WCK32_02740 [Chlorobiaceae bacterium]